jgi:hypothetical protein
MKPGMAELRLDAQAVVDHGEPAGGQREALAIGVGDRIAAGEPACSLTNSHSGLRYSKTGGLAGANFLTGELAVIPWLYMANHFWGE